MINNVKLSFYVSGETDSWLEERKELNWGDAVVTRPVSVHRMHSWLQAHPNAFIAALPTGDL